MDQPLRRDLKPDERRNLRTQSIGQRKMNAAQALAGANLGDGS
jgi:hypothetical protein